MDEFEFAEGIEGWISFDDFCAIIGWVKKTNNVTNKIVGTMYSAY